MDYSDMKFKTAQGEALRDYTLNANYFRENEDLLPFDLTRMDLEKVS